MTTRMAKQEVGAQGSVTGLDINASMLTKAKELAPNMNINWIESDVVKIDLPSSTFDAIISQHGYHYFPNQTAALNEFYRLVGTQWAHLNVYLGRLARIPSNLRCCREIYLT